MVVLLRVGLPEQPEERELEFLASVFPIVIDHFCELFDAVHGHEFLVLLLEESHHPPLVAGQGHILASFEFHFDDGLFQELGGEHFFAFEDEAVLVCFDEGVVDFCEFVPAGEGEVEVGRQSDVVRRYSRERFDFPDAFDSFYFGYGYLFFLVLHRRFGFFGVDGDDEAFVVGVELIEFLFGGHEFEGFGPVELGSVAHPVMI